MSAAPRGARARDPEALAIAEQLPVTARRLRRIVRDISAIGSYDLGFRVAGTPEDRATAEYVADALRSAGLDECGVERVRVDGWRVRGASVAIVGGRTYEASGFGGVPGTPPKGLTAELVDGGRGDRHALRHLDVAGKLVLVDWDRMTYHPRLAGLELGQRGARGLIVNCPPGGPYYGAPNALGTFHGSWHDEAPPFVMIRKEHAAAIRRSLATGSVTATMTLTATLKRGAVGFNSIGYLGSGDPRRPIVVGAHHDGWFRGAWDNATGVAALIVLAEALRAAGIEPRHRLAFSSRTGEEYGRVGTDFDWCVGAWEQISGTHPDWGANAAFHLCLEASGQPDMRLIMLTPPELSRWARAACRTASEKGWLTSGWYSDRPSTGTEQWPFMLRGVPGVCPFNWEDSFRKTLYHTTFDARLDFDHLERMTRFYAYLLLMADRDPDGILDHRDRARDVVRATRDCGVPTVGLEQAAELHAGRKGRAAFTRVGRQLCAVDSQMATCYPHTQPARDLERLQAALDLIASDQPRLAARQLCRVGDNNVAPSLGRDANAVHQGRRVTDSGSTGWIGASHLAVSPNLWEEINALRGDPDARQPGPWIERSLGRHVETTRRNLTRQIARMQRALE